MRAISFFAALTVCTAVFAQGAQPWRASTPGEQQLDAAAFAGVDNGIAEKLGDVQSVVVVLHGRVVYQYYRDGNPDTLRDVQSVTKSALAVLVGNALQRGELASIDRPVLELMPGWRALNADPRAASVTLRHLLALTAGFEPDDATGRPSGTAPPLPPQAAWARRMVAAPGERFSYDNSAPVLVASILEAATGQPMASLVRDRLLATLDMREPSYAGSIVRMRTLDMAKLGQLMLQDGEWAGQRLMPPGFAAETAKPQSAGGPPVGLPYGLFWWTASSTTYFASGYGGQLVWVHVPLGLVVAATSAVSPQSQQRGQVLGLVRGRIFQAAQRRVAAGG